MATRAEQFRYEQERSKPPRPKTVKRKRPNVGTHQARGVADGTSHEHTGAKGASKATVVIEMAVGQPSRKSTRASANGAKSGQSREHALAMKSATAQARHNRRGG
jgi:hypothetical protein